jgi:hypothetical protein
LALAGRDFLITAFVGDFEIEKHATERLGVLACPFSYAPPVIHTQNRSFAARISIGLGGFLKDKQDNANKGCRRLHHGPHEHPAPGNPLEERPAQTTALGLHLF